MWTFGRLGGCCTQDKRAGPFLQPAGPLFCTALQHALFCSPLAHPVVQPAGPPFCAARQPAENSCFSCGNIALQPAGHPFSIILWKKSQHYWQCKVGYISVRGLWNSCEKTYFDIRITHPTSHSQSYSWKSLAVIYQQHEKEDKYNQRVIARESSFNPFLHNKWTNGTRMQQSQQKTGRKNSWRTQGAICICHNINILRTKKLRFALLRSTLAAISGFWDKRSDVHFQDLMDIHTDFSLIPRPTIIQSWTMVSMTWHQISYVCEISS